MHFLYNLEKLKYGKSLSLVEKHVERKELQLTILAFWNRETSSKLVFLTVKEIYKHFTFRSFSSDVSAEIIYCSFLNLEKKNSKGQTSYCLELKTTVCKPDLCLNKLMFHSLYYKDIKIHKNIGETSKEKNKDFPSFFLSIAPTLFHKGE